MKNCLSVTESEAFESLRTSLPEADRTFFTDETLHKIARHVLTVRGRAPWAGTIPEDIFKAFVLIPRINNEAPCFYHETIYDELKDGLYGLSMKDAALLVNRWCLSKATYQSTDDRTLDALSVIRRGFGRCGEESTLLTSALRSVGIPARQVYSPRWTHCDDNHAWVEAYIDGGWHYLGACEPEPDLDSGWFTAAASKSMLIHTRAYGVRPENERIETAYGNVYELNCLGNYADTALLKLYITNGGRPAKGLHVRFEVLNYGEFYALTEKDTDDNGYVDFLTGIGTLHLHIGDEKHFLDKDVDLRENCEYHIDFSESLSGEQTGETFYFSQAPAKETRIQKAPADTPEAAEYRKKTAADDLKRRTRLSEYAAEAKQTAAECASLYPELKEWDLLPLFESARGNIGEIRSFLMNPEFAPEDKLLLLTRLREKDLVDTASETLSDALRAALPYKTRYPAEIWTDNVLCPRVMNETLCPVREKIRTFFEDRRFTPESLYRYLTDRITLYHEPYETIAPDFFEVLKNGRCPDDQAGILYVTIARALGIACRLSSETGIVEYYDGGNWIPLRKEDAADALLTLENASSDVFTFGTDITIGRLHNGYFKTLTVSGSLEKERKFMLQAGTYRLIISRRFPDGSVDGKYVLFTLDSGCEKRYTVTPITEKDAVRPLDLPLPMLRAFSENASERTDIRDLFCGSPSIIAFAAPDEEPSIHLLNELLDAEAQIRSGNVSIILIAESGKDLENQKIRKIFETLPNVRLFHSPEEKDVRALREAVGKLELRMPLTIGTDRNGSVAAAFSNYNVGTVGTLLKLVK